MLFTSNVPFSFKFLYFKSVNRHNIYRCAYLRMMDLELEFTMLYKYETIAYFDEAEAVLVLVRTRIDQYTTLH